MTKMDIKSLSQDVRKYLRSGININSVLQCVMELVLNSLDAKSTSIAVRINLQTFRIQVVDNGIGITKANMNLVGIRYMTSKCQTIEDLQRIKTFGYRGESLASIKEMSKKMTITSRPQDIENTYSKTHIDSKWNTVESVKQRPSYGTTITVEDFMHNMPVRQKRINQNLDVHEIKRDLECLAVIHPHVSFNLRNDVSGKIVFQCNKSQSVAQTLTNLHSEIDGKNLMNFKVTKGKIKVSGFIYKDKLHNNKIQFLYLNKRPIISQRIQYLINSLLLKSVIFKNSEKSQHPVYIMNIRCPYSEIDLTLSPSKKTIEFKQWDVILKCIYKATRKLLERENLIDTSLSIPNPIDEPEIVSVHSKGGVSQMKDAVKSLPAKRKIVKSELNNIKKHFKDDNSNFNQKKKLWNVDKDLILGNEVEVSNKEAEDTNECSFDVYVHKKDIVTTTAIIHKEKAAHKIPKKKLGREITLFDNFTNIQLSNNKEVDGNSSKNIIKSIVKEANVEESIKIISENRTKKPNIEQTTEVKDLEIIDSNKTNISNNSDKNIPTLPNKHINTQSLLLNSVINASKPSYSWLNSKINTTILEDQDKGKDLIMDMFLKSTVAFPNELSEIKEKNAVVSSTNVENKKTRPNPNTTMMTMSVKFMSKKTIVTNSIRDWNLPYVPNKEARDSGNNEKKKTRNQKDDLKVSKCIQTTMIEHQREFQVNLNCAQPPENILNPRFGNFYNLGHKDCNINFSRFEKAHHERNKPEFHNYRDYLNFQNSPKLNYFEQFPSNYNNGNYFRNNRDNYYIRNHHDLPFSLGNNFNDNCFNYAYKNNFRKPIKRYFSDYNFNFSNFQAFDKSYLQFIKQQKNLNNQDNFFPPLTNNTNCMIHPNPFPSNDRNVNWENFIPDDFTIPLYQSYNPYKCNNFNEFRKFPKFQFENRRSCAPTYLGQFPRNNEEPSIFNYKKNVYFDINNIDNIPYKNSKCDLVNLEDHRMYRQTSNGQKEPHICNKAAKQTRCYSPYFKKPRDENNFFRKRRTRVHHHNLRNCHFPNQNFQKHFDDNKLFDEDVHCVSPYFQKVPRNYFPFNFRNQCNNMKIHNPKNTVRHQEPGAFYRPLNKQLNLLPVDEEISNFCRQDHIQRKRSYGFFENRPDDNFLMKDEPKKQLKQQRHFCNDQDNKLIRPSKNICQTSKNLYRKYNTEPLCQKVSSNNVLNSKTDKKGENFKKARSEAFGFFCNPDFPPYIDKHADTEYSFITPNINKSTRLSNECREEINLLDSSITRVDSTVCFDNFNPKLSSTQYCGNVLNLSIIEDSVQKTRFSSNVVDGTPDKNFDNFFVPSLAMLSQKANAPDFVGQNGYQSNNDVKKLNEENKQSSILEITIDTSKFKLLTENIVNDCKTNKKFSNDESEQLKTNPNKNLIFSEVNMGDNLESDNIEKQWVKKTDYFGRTFHVHKRTGMTSIHTPKQQSNFDFVKRLEFIPKGLSPILIEAKQVDRSLSPTSKKSLYATIMECYEEELSIIKWSKYICDYKDARKFFEELYREKAKLFENTIPNVNVHNLPRSMVKLYSKSHGRAFSKDIFNDLMVIGQLDKKFIIGMSKIKNLLILFDQHAVHERIRLERLFEDYTEAQSDIEKFIFKSRKCPNGIALNLMEIDLNILINSRKLFETLGLSYVISENRIEVTHIPTCMYNKFIKNGQTDTKNLENILTSLIYEQISTILSTRGTVSKIPNILQNIINLEACRGAVKFGDKLTIKDCEEHIRQLSKCKLPFQCAHGRPTMVPVIDLNNDSSNETEKPNLIKLKNK